MKRLILILGILVFGCLGISPAQVRVPGVLTNGGNAYPVVPFGMVSGSPQIVATMTALSNQPSWLVATGQITHVLSDGTDWRRVGGTNNASLVQVTNSDLQDYTRLIDSNTTIVVAPTGGDFTNVQSALASLDNTFIGQGIFVTIQVNDGTYASTSPINSFNTFGKQIAIRGQNVYTKALSSIQSSSGSAGAWSLVLNLDSVANVVTNDYVIIYAGTNGVNPTYVDGCFKVTNVDVGNTRITISSTHRAPTAPSGAVTATVKVVKSILAFSGCSGMLVWNGATTVGELDKLVFVGDGTGAGLDIQDTGRVNNPTLLGIVGFSVNIFATLESHFINSGVVAASGATYYNYQSQDNSFIGGNLLISSGSDIHGFFAERNGVFTGNLLSTGNAGAGYLAFNRGVLNLVNSTATGNQGYGYEQSYGGHIYHTGDITANNSPSDYKIALEVNSGAGIGAYAQTIPPTNGLIVSGRAGFGTASPRSPVDVAGTNGLEAGGVTGLLTVGDAGTNGSSLFVNTPSINASLPSGFGVDGTYAAQKSTVNLKAFGVYSGGGYNSAMAFHTSPVGGGPTAPTEKMRILGNGNVGIGTTTPGYSLEVVNSASTVAALLKGSGGAYAVGIGSLTDGAVIQAYDYPLTTTASLLLNSGGGNVGIGTTSPGAKLEVAGNIVASTGFIGDGVGLTNLPNTLSNVTDSGYSAVVRSNLVVTGGGAGLPGLTVGGNVLVTTNGNVGIGTTVPGYSLEVVNASSTIAVVFKGSAGASAVGIGSVTEGAFVQAYNYPLNDGSDLLVNPIGGNVGIGTLVPRSKLDVAGTNGLEAGGVTGLLTVGDAGTNGSSLFVNTPSINASLPSGLGVDGAHTNQTSIINLKAFGVYSGGGYNSAMAFYTSPVGGGPTAPTEKMRILGNGNVGIGTTTPGYSLEVVSPASTIAALLKGSGGAYAVGIGSLTDGAVIQAYDYPLTATASLLLNTGGGNVGIGTTTPAAKLDVGGDILTAGNLLFEGATADGFETALMVTDPTADRTVTFQNASGTVAYLSDISASGGTNRYYEAGEAFHWVELGGTNGDPYAIKGSVASATVPDWTITYSGNVGSIANFIADGSVTLSGVFGGGLSMPFASATVMGSVSDLTAGQSIRVDAAGTGFEAYSTLTNTAQFDTDNADIVLGTAYTNSTRRLQIFASFQLNAAAAGTAKVTVYSILGTTTNKLTISAGPLASLTTTEPLTMRVQPGGYYYYADETSGTGATAAFAAGTHSRFWE